MIKDILKLIILIVLVIGLCVSIYYAGKSMDNQSKYRHPITQPGAGW